MTGSEPNPEEVFDVERIRQLVELMEEHGLSEIDLRREEQRIRLRRGSDVDAAPALPAALPEAAQVAPPAATSAETAAAPAEDNKNLIVIKSPMVGTFYSRPNPDSAAFVKVGDHISADTTVCIIEAMKVFNEIPAESSGTIVAVLAEDDEPVEFGKPLFKVDTSK